MVRPGNHMLALMIYERNYTGLPQQRFGENSAEPSLLCFGSVEWRSLEAPDSLGGGSFSGQSLELAGSSSQSYNIRLAGTG